MVLESRRASFLIFGIAEALEVAKSFEQAAAASDTN